jgi:hypothetical protein
MKKMLLVLLLFLSSNAVFANDKFYGLYTTDNIPTGKCKVTESRPLHFSYTDFGKLRDSKGSDRTYGILNKMRYNFYHNASDQRANYKKANALVGYRFDLTVVPSTSADYFTFIGNFSGVLIWCE